MPEAKKERARVVASAELRAERKKSSVLDLPSCGEERSDECKVF